MKGGSTELSDAFDKMVRHKGRAVLTPNAKYFIMLMLYNTLAPEDSAGIQCRRFLKTSWEMLI